MMPHPSTMSTACKTSSTPVDTKSFLTVNTPSTIKVKSPGIRTHQRVNNISKRERFSVEDDTVIHEAKRRVVDHGLLGAHVSPKVDTTETVRMSNAWYKNQSLVTNSTSTTTTSSTISSSTNSWSPLPIRECGVSSIKRSPYGRPYQATPTYKHRPMSFADMPFLQASASLACHGGSIPPPPTTFDSLTTSKAFLLSQPMIASPSPSLFFLNESASRFPHDTPSRTPIRNGTFDRSIFSPECAFSSLGQNKASNFTGRTSHEDIISPALAFAAHFCDPIDVAKKDFTPLSILTMTVGSEASDISPDVIAIGAGKNNKVLAIIEVERTSYDCLPLSVHRHSSNSSIFPSNEGDLQFLIPMEPIQGVPLHGKTFPMLASKVLPVPTRRFQDSDGGRGADDIDLFCTCPKSRCLKLYCVCFQRNSFCDKAVCKCKKCKNNKRECGKNGDRTKAIEKIKKKKPAAFEKRVKETEKGCRCKRNRCLKKYCVCFSEGNSCDDRCKCVACHNTSMPGSTEEAGVHAEKEIVSNPRIVAV